MHRYSSTELSPIKVLGAIQSHFSSIRFACGHVHLSASPCAGLRHVAGRRAALCRRTHNMSVLVFCFELSSIFEAPKKATGGSPTPVCLSLHVERASSILVCRQAAVNTISQLYAIFPFIDCCSLQPATARHGSRPSSASSTHTSPSTPSTSPASTNKPSATVLNNAPLSVARTPRRLPQTQPADSLRSTSTHNLAELSRAQLQSASQVVTPRRYLPDPKQGKLIGKISEKMQEEERLRIEAARGAYLCGLRCRWADS